MLSKPEEESHKGLVPRDRFVERGILAAVLGFELLVLSLVPVWFLTVYTFGLSLVQARERKKREKRIKFRIKPINGQTLIFDFL